MDRRVCEHQRTKCREPQRHNARGLSVYRRPHPQAFHSQVGRAIFQPDILFVADELGVSPDGIPIAFNRTDNTVWVDNYTNNLGPAQLLTTNVGPALSRPYPVHLHQARSGH